MINNVLFFSECDPSRNSLAGHIVLRLQKGSNSHLQIVPENVLENTQQMQNAMPRSKSRFDSHGKVQSQIEEVQCQMRENT